MDQTESSVSKNVLSLPSKRTHEDDQESPSKKPDRFRATNLYDRQIRLWGWEAQQRLMKSRILMYGLDGIGTEVLKNLMLGGIKQITVIDPQAASEENLTTNFFLRETDLKLNRAAASAERAKLLNPSCTLDHSESEASAIDAPMVRKYDLVILNGCPVKEVVRIGELCRGLGIPIFVSQVLGFHAFYFNDLNGLSFEIPPVSGAKTEVPKTLADANGPSTSKEGETSKSNSSFFKRRIDGQVMWENGSDVSDQPKQLKVKTSSIGDVLTKEAMRRSGIASPLSKRMFGLKRMDPYLNMEILLMFVDRHGRYPSHHTKSADQLELENIVKEILPSGDTRVVDLPEFLTSEASYTCAIFGGTLGQDIITVLTRRGYPIFNMYYLTANDAVGSREYVE